jgi:hypothetical protein
MRRRKEKREVEGHSQPVAMHIAASLVFHQLNGTLNATALALSQVADVFYLDDGELKPIPRADLASGSFEESAAIYRAASGRVYRSLSMRRGDLMEAITILRRASAD